MCLFYDHFISFKFYHKDSSIGFDLSIYQIKRILVTNQLFGMKFYCLQSGYPTHQVIFNTSYFTIRNHNNFEFDLVILFKPIPLMIVP